MTTSSASTGATRAEATVNLTARGVDLEQNPWSGSAVKFFWEVFVTLFVIIDPVGTLAAF
jgi:hypothetical protein